MMKEVDVDQKENLMIFVRNNMQDLDSLQNDIISMDLLNLIKQTGHLIFDVYLI